LTAAQHARRLDRIAVAVADSPDLDFARLLDKKGAAAKPRANAEAWSLMLYTSGTTSRPKGVPRRHRAERAAAVAHVAQNLYSRGERTLGVIPLYHTMGVRSLLAMSLVGGTFVCLRGSTRSARWRSLPASASPISTWCRRSTMTSCIIRCLPVPT
jgi:2-furoate---CoA ligase